MLPGQMTTGSGVVFHSCVYCAKILAMNLGFSFMPILVFIPGLLCTSALFQAQIDVLETTHKIMIADTTGLDSISAMSERILAQTDGPLILFGLSMGGYVAMEMARLAPERMAGLGLLNTAHRADDGAKRKQRAATIKMAESDRFRGVTRHLLKSFLSPQAMADDAVVARVFAMTEAVGRTNFVLQQYAILGRRDQSDTLASLRMPVLVLCGALDTLTPPALSVDMAGLVPDSRLVILDDVGHLSSLEAPQAVTDALQQLFDDF